MIMVSEKFQKCNIFLVDYYSDGRVRHIKDNGSDMYLMFKGIFTLYFI